MACLESVDVGKMVDWVMGQRPVPLSDIRTLKNKRDNVIAKKVEDEFQGLAHPGRPTNPDLRSPRS
jgi:hypothetical protein